MRRKIVKTIIDSNGIPWEWDGARLRVEDSDDEFRTEGTPVNQNGYWCYTWKQVLDELLEGLFISEQRYQQEIVKQP